MRKNKFKEEMVKFQQRVGGCRLDEVLDDFSNLAAWQCYVECPVVGAGKSLSGDTLEWLNFSFCFTQKAIACKYGWEDVYQGKQVHVS